MPLLEEDQAVIGTGGDGAGPRPEVELDRPVAVGEAVVVQLAQGVPAPGDHGAVTAHGHAVVRTGGYGHHAREPGNHLGRRP